MEPTEHPDPIEVEEWEKRAALRPEVIEVRPERGGITFDLADGALDVEGACCTMFATLPLETVELEATLDHSRRGFHSPLYWRLIWPIRRRLRRMLRR